PRNDFRRLVLTQLLNGTLFARRLVLAKRAFDQPLAVARVSRRRAVDAADDLFLERLVEKFFQKMLHSFLHHEDQHIAGMFVEKTIGMSSRFLQMPLQVSQAVPLDLAWNRLVD